MRELCEDASTEDDADGRWSAIAEGAGNGNEGRPFENDGGVAGDVSSQGRYDGGGGGAGGEAMAKVGEVVGERSNVAREEEILFRMPVDSQS